MGIDRDTNPSFFSLSFDDSQEIIKSMRKNAEDNGYNESLEEGSKKKLLLDNDNFNVSTEEYYVYDDELYISINLKSIHGEGSGLISIPLSDEVLIDIIQFSLKKLNKLKTAMETLK